MAAAADDPVESLHMDFEKLVADYSDEIISYYDVFNVEKRYASSLGSGSADSPCPIQWVTLADWHDLAYQELLSVNNKCLHDLVNIEARVKGLLSQSSESVDKYEALQIFLEEYLKFLKLSKDDLLSLSKNKCYMLMILIKSFVAHFDDSLSSYEYGKHLFSLSDLCQIPELQQQMIIKFLCTNQSRRSESAFSDSTCQSVWVRLDDWHDLAHRELKSIRHMYLPQLFKAYQRVCGLGSESSEFETKYLPVNIFLLEYCKFLTLSRAGIVGLSKGECYVFMMLIKSQLWQQLLPTGSQSQIPELQDETDIRVEFLDHGLVHKPASSDPLLQIQPEWVVQAHQELQSLRNMYSAKLDKIHKEIFQLWSQSNIKYDSTRIEVMRASNFLAMSRADVYDFGEENFNEIMRNLKEYVKLPLISEDQGLTSGSEAEASRDSSRVIQFEGFTNPNDQLYEEIQLMRKKYVPVLLRAYNILNGLSPMCGNRQTEKDGICLCIKFLEVPRSYLGIAAKDDYETWMEFLKSVLAWTSACMPPIDCLKMEQSALGYRELKRSCYEMN